MKRERRFSAACLLPVLVLLLAACGSPNLEQRIARGQEELSTWPTEVQAAIREGRIEVGFTREQVRMAWGEPDRKSVETTSEGTFEYWYWEKESPAIGIGFGVGSFGSHSGVSGGVGTTIGGDSSLLALARFKSGELVSFQRAGNSEGAKAQPKK